ncbi:alpha/beta hydrolase family protein [Pedobacter sp. KLB.chiD]|uniref:alpha/beta hydrolase family protein n=1 Tax=Pedobacter sp. KLB.chiD TaxID=3387402 RepID=UPI0039995780
MERKIVSLGVLLLFVSLAYAQRYRSEEVVFHSAKDSITYGGTLTIPKGRGPFTAVVIVSGTGKQDRDGTMGGHKIFLDIADGLSENGYAVFRLDDRGVGKTSGVYEQATTLDFANDALAAVAYLRNRKEINAKKIGLLGHSEGGIAISIAAANSKQIAFLISIAGLASNGLDALIRQNRDLVANSQLTDYDKARSNDINELMFKTAYQYADSANMEAKLNEAYNLWKVKDDAYFKTLNQPFDHFRFPAYSYVKMATTPWYRFFIKYNAIKTLAQIKIPVLALNGDRDLMVAGKENLQHWKEYTRRGGNNRVDTVLIPNLNHLFLPCVACNQAEIPSIKAGFSDVAMKLMIDWLKKRF